MKQFWATCVLLLCVTTARAATADRAMVVTGHPLATDAAVEVLRSGGNAVDAAVAAALMLGVVDGHNSGIGGGCFMIVHSAAGEMIALDGRETAPAAAQRDMFLRDGKPDTRLSQVGALAVGVPGSIQVFDHALNQFGNKKLAEVIEPAAKVAEDGFPINRLYAQRLRETRADLARFADSKRILLSADGQPRNEGDVLKQPELAKSYRAIAEHGIDWFYKGDFAKSVEQWMKANGGIVTADDFAKYTLVARSVLMTKYRGRTIVGFPPPSSGGVHVAQILGMIERFDLAATEKEDPAARVHVIAEAMKLAFADRAHWLGDPAFANVPRGLIDAEYVARLSKKIDPARASPVASHGDPPRAGADTFEKHTTHIAAADAQGNWVAITTSLNTAFGAKVIVPGTGVLLNNHMDDFSIQPGVPNSFGLVGAEANAIAPLKRPLSSMSPTIVLDADGRPFMTVGAAGGPKIISQVVLAISNHIDLGGSLDGALARPRFHHQWKPGTLWIERTFDAGVLDRLRAMGHELEVVDPVGATQAIARPRADGAFDGVAEPRMQGKAAGL